MEMAFPLNKVGGVAARKFNNLLDDAFCASEPADLMMLTTMK
jgi:hypothetical protein